jgi:hypothetical protein
MPDDWYASIAAIMHKGILNGSFIFNKYAVT